MFGNLLIILAITVSFVILLWQWRHFSSCLNDICLLPIDKWCNYLKTKLDYSLTETFWFYMEGKKKLKQQTAYCLCFFSLSQLIKSFCQKQDWQFRWVKCSDLRIKNVTGIKDVFFFFSTVKLDDTFRVIFMFTELR